jgi:hypothetical protein
MKVPSSFTGRPLPADDLRSKQAEGGAKPAARPATAARGTGGDSFEKVQASGLGALLRPPTADAPPDDLSGRFAGAMASVLGDPAAAARLAAQGPQVAALPGFAPTVEVGRQALVGGDGSVREAFLGRLGDLAGPGKADSSAVLFHVFGGILDRLQGRLAETGAGPRPSLGDEMRALEAEQEEIRNRRQMSTTAFESFDQKANQLYQMLSSIVKTVAETRSLGSASRTGL